MEPILSVRDLHVHFRARQGMFARRTHLVRAVDGISFDLHKGETIGVVGESGSGKTILLKTIVGLVQPTSGTIDFRGKTVNHQAVQQTDFRRKIQIVLQNPYTSLPPRRTIRDILLEPLRIHQVGTAAEREKRIAETLTLVGLNPAVLGLRTEQLSGGQRQRINVTRALMLDPEVLLCDEPVSALDVSIKAQVLNLFQDLRNKLGLTYIFVAHDLSAVRYICDRIAVMVAGRFVEIASNADLYRAPLHPYTRALLAAVPTVKKGLNGDRFGQGSDLSMKLAGGIFLCARHGACPLGPERCALEPPSLVEVAPGHFVAMHGTAEDLTSLTAIYESVS